MTEVEYDAIMQSNNAEDIAFFISVTFIFKRGLRNSISYLLMSFEGFIGGFDLADSGIG
ncbi:hypothetical protein [Brenneria alni]|uniref:hypothetical protein n=1 Tax=Brenneria alni TaxID=71656 RepID=UPI001475BE26|nr:hypothetical protein [Brenneria alni]